MLYSFNAAQSYTFLTDCMCWSMYSTECRSKPEMEDDEFVDAEEDIEMERPAQGEQRRRTGWASVIGAQHAAKTAFKRKHSGASNSRSVGEVRDLGTDDEN